MGGRATGPRAARGLRSARRIVVKYLLDTNAWIRYVNKPRSAIARRLATLQPDDVRLCSVVLGELYYGAYKSSRRPTSMWSARFPANSPVFRLTMLRP